MCVGGSRWVGGWVGMGGRGAHSIHGGRRGVKGGELYN